MITSTPFLDRKSCKETSKAQIFYIVVSIYEGMVFSFLTLFLNECRRSLSWTPLMSSFSLFFPALGAAIGIFFTSFLVGHQKRNLRLMRIISLCSFLAILCFGFLGLFLPNGLGENGEVSSEHHFYLLFTLFTFFPSLLMAFHWSFLSLQTSNIADINFAEKTGYGHVCIFGVLAPIVASPLSGFLAESVFSSYKGYLFSFLLSTPLLLVLFFLTFWFKPFPTSTFHSDDHEKVRYLDLFKNKKYTFYLFLASMWIPLIYASDSLSSNLWTTLESSGPILNAFNPLSWGLFIAASSLAEFAFIFINTKIGFGKKVRFSVTLAFALLCLECIGFGVISYFFRASIESGLSLAILVIIIHSAKGMSSGLYSTSNIMIIHHLLGPKLRRKAVFIAPCIYQLINAILQLSYPYLSSYRYISFFALSLIALIGTSLSFLLDGSLLRKKSDHMLDMDIDDD